MNQLINDAATTKKIAPDYVDFARIMRTFAHSKKIIFATTLTCFFLGCLYVLFAPPIYRSNVLIKVDVGDSTSKGIPANLSGIFDVKTAASSEMEMLRSRSVVAKAVDSAQMYIIVKPHYFPLIGTNIARKNSSLSTPGFFGYGGYVWGNETIEIKRFDVPISFEKKQLTVKITGENSYELHDGQSVILDGKVGADISATTPKGNFYLKIDSINAGPSAEFHVTRIPREDAVEELQKKLVIGERSKQSGMISVELEGSDPALIANVLNEISIQYIKQNIDIKTEEAERSLAFLETQLPGLQSAIESGEARYSAFRNKRGTVDVGEEVKAILQQSVQAQLRLVELRQKRADLMTRFQDKNPIVESIDQQIRTITSEISAVNEKIRKVPSTEQDLVRLTRDVRVNTELYSSLLNTVQQLKLVQASRVGSAKLIDAAVRPSTSSKPNRKLALAASVGVGLALGLAAALARKKISGKLESSDEISGVVGNTPVISVPQSSLNNKITSNLSKETAGKNLLAAKCPDHPAIQSLHTVVNFIDNSCTSAKNNTLALVSPVAGSGKSFIAANLAALISRSGKKVLLIDADLRNGNLHSFFEIQQKIGLTDLLLGNESFDSALKVNVLTGLDLITVGEFQPWPTEVLSDRSLEKILREASSRYDQIIIDTSMALNTADALMVTKHSDVILCVTPKGKTTVELLVKMLNKFAQNGQKIAGFVFNRSDLTH